jgi:DNA-binding IclR family transcriptional regulator
LSVEDKLGGIDSRTSAFKILFYLAFKDNPMKPAEISRGLGEKGSTVRARLTELKQAGLVSMSPDGYLAVPTTYDMIMKLYRELEEKIMD